MIPSRRRLPHWKPDSVRIPESWRVYLLTAVVIGCGCLHIVLAIGSIQQKSATYDEIAHITAGYSYWTLNDYRLHPENGNLPQRWMTLPLITFFPELRFPELDSPTWQSSDLWQIGDEFFHTLGNDAGKILLATRTAIGIVSIAVCGLVFFWSRSLFGAVGGLISLLLCVLSPTMLAHGRLATSDLLTTFFFAASVWAVWELLHRFSLTRLAVGAGAVSGLFLCKTSAVLILPISIVLALITLTPRQVIVVRVPHHLAYELATQRSRRLYVVAVTICIGLMAYSSVWAAYGFRFSASPNADHAFYKFQDIETVAGKSGVVGRTAGWLAKYKVLPEAYLYGAAFVAAHEERSAFLNGDYQTTGWRHFFPYCLAVKTPLPLFGILALGFVPCVSGHAVRSNRGSFANAGWQAAYQLIPISIALVLLWSVFLGTQLNIGHRHILPTYPLMFVLAGGAAKWCRKETWIAAGTIALLLIWFAAESFAAFPHYLSYFNQSVPRGEGYRHLVDSSLDWGQDLPSLKKWLDVNTTDDEPIFLAYFGTSRPGYYEIEATPLPLLSLPSEPTEFTAGTYCISATCLQSVYGFAPGRWNREYEASYQELKSHAAATGEPIDSGARQQLDALRARRLAAHLRHREPDDQVGGSILIYQVSHDELQTALSGLPAELDSLSWATRRALQTQRGDR